MDICIDIGNSYLKWAYVVENKLKRSDVVDYKQISIKQIVAKMLDQVSIQVIIVVNVAGDLLLKGMKQQLKEQGFSGQFIEVFSQKRAFGVINAYCQPEKLGVDRWVALIAARQQSQQAVCIIDIGTAITLDVMDDKGRHQGGWIIPGRHLMQTSLIQQTQQIKDSMETSLLDSSTLTLADNTQQAIAGGTHYVIVNFIQQIVQDLSKQYKDLTTILTGGDSQNFIAALTDQISYQPQLVLQGLLVILRQGEKV